MKFTLEAIYMLQLFNDSSDDLAFIPLPILDGENRKTALQRTIEKGYEDLKSMSLIIDGKPTEKCMEYGYYLKEYQISTYHYQIDREYFCAPAVDDFKRMTVVLSRDEEGLYLIERLPSVLILGIVMRDHLVLHHIDDRVKDYLHSNYEKESLFHLFSYHKNAEALRIIVEEFDRVTQDNIYFLNHNSLYEYDMSKQLLRSIDGEKIRHSIVRKMRVKV